MDSVLVGILIKLGVGALGYVIAWVVYRDNKVLREENNTIRDKILVAFVGEAQIKIRQEIALTTLSQGVSTLIQAVGKLK